MERSTINVYFWILLTVLICWVVRCGKLDSYSFPVYTTASCPRSQSEWKNRSSDLNCTDSNGYMCIPNENITELLEFCYRYPRIPIEKSICLILKRSSSLVEAYSCKQFRNGCPDKQYWSDELFRYPSCLSIGRRCFLIEPFCSKQGKTNLNTSFQSTVFRGNGYENSTWVWILVLGVFFLFPIILVCLLVIKLGRGKKRNLDASLKKMKPPKEKGYSSPERNSSNEGKISEIEETPLIESGKKEHYENHAQASCLSRNTKLLDICDSSTEECTKKYEELSKGERCVLFLLLCSDENTIVLENKRLTKRSLELFGALNILKMMIESIHALQLKGFVSIVDKKVTFASENVQSETMSDYQHTFDCEELTKFFFS